MKLEQLTTKINGVAVIKFYYKTDKFNPKTKIFISFREYFKLKSENEVEIVAVTHLGFKYNIDSDVSVISLCTSRNKTCLPEIGEVNNIPLFSENENIQYMNPLLFFKKIIIFFLLRTQITMNSLVERR
jgi:hypothetical protein